MSGSAGANFLTDYDRSNFDSDFLCPHCGGLIYLDTANQPNDVCINSKCPLWPRDFDSIIDATKEQEPRIYREINEEEELLINKIHCWKPGKLARYAYQGRRELITPLFTTGIMPSIDYFIDLGELLLMTNMYSSEGTIADIDEFRQLLQDVRKWSQDLRNLEDVQTRRIVFGRTKSGLKPLSIKYSKVIAEFQQGLGIMSSIKLPPKESLFPYEHLEAAVTPKPDFSTITDYGQILDLFWPASLQMRYWLQGHHRTKTQYNYIPDLLDLTVFCGWLDKTWGKADLHIIPYEKLEKETREIQSHFDSQSDKGYSAKNFFNTYVDNTGLVPIVARTSEGIIMDYHTLLFFLIYLHGCPDPKEPALKKRGEIIQNMKGRVGEKFESWLRKEIRNKGYEGPDCPIKVPMKTGYEYDIVAISERRKAIVIADAKYRDMAPSSFTGTNLISQELLGDHALRYEADLQQKRIVYFRNNLEKFREHLNPKLPWEDYNVQSFLITKHTPLASRYKEVAILRANELLQTLT
jgi:hypothetical protein